MASAEIDRPAPSARRGCRVEALTLTASRSQPEERRRSRRASRRGGRRAAAGRRRSSGRRWPVASRRPRPGARTSSTSSSRWRCRAASGRRPGRADPRSPRPVAPSSASATAWRTTSPSEWPAARGAPAISTPPSGAACPGPNGWLSWPMPVRVRRASRPGPRRLAARSPGSVTLRLPGSPGTTWTGDATGFEQGGLVGERLGPSGGKRRQASRSRSRRTPCGVCAVAEPGPVDRRRRPARRRSA